MEYHDALETRDPQSREAALFAALARQIDNAKRNAPAYAERFANISSTDIHARAELARLPLLRKSELTELQKKSPPFGGLSAVLMGSLGHVFQSPGPIYEPESRRGDDHRLVRAMFAAGFRAGDLVHNTFAYHLTPAGIMADFAARSLGCAVFPAGTGQTELQVAAIAALRPQAYVGTPSFLRIILEKAVETGADVSSIKKALVSGEALLPAVRNQLRTGGIATFQCYATADVGLIAYESVAMEGMIVDENVIVEIVRPGTGEPVAEGEVGELVVTTLVPEYPLIRFATGDLSAVLPGGSPCGRTNMRIKGWMGRADQTTKVRGMFVHPSQVADVVKRHPEILKARLVVEHDASQSDRMTLHCEIQGTAPAALAEAVRTSMRDLCKLRGEVTFVAPASLPNDGKVIADQRVYQ